jgi:hypothetical protein
LAALCCSQQWAVPGCRRHGRNHHESTTLKWLVFACGWLKIRVWPESFG